MATDRKREIPAFASVTLAGGDLSFFSMPPLAASKGCKKNTTRYKKEDYTYNPPKPSFDKEGLVAFSSLRSALQGLHFSPFP
ncbi:MAG: hypothetical protein E7132_04320 [Rikenellaceae bacterium]|nr:hypothetical protein [Rikenellaceae bacterium]